VCNKYGAILCQRCYLKKITISHPYPDTTTFVSYRDTHIREIIRTAKYHSSPEVLNVFAESFSEYIFDVYSELILTRNTLNIILLPVPISRKRYRIRGYNQSTILASYVAKSLKKTYNINAFVKDNFAVRIKDTQLAHLDSKADRLKAIQGAFKVATPVDTDHTLVFIIDDVVTTGATSSEFAKLVRSDSSQQIEILAIAH
jgi:ComF family protein